MRRRCDASLLFRLCPRLREDTATNDIEQRGELARDKEKTVRGTLCTNELVQTLSEQDRSTSRKHEKGLTFLEQGEHLRKEISRTGCDNLRDDFSNVSSSPFNGDCSTHQYVPSLSIRQMNAGMAHPKRLAGCTRHDDRAIAEQ